MKFKIAGISFLLLLFFTISTVSAQNLDSRTGDEAALEALAGSLSGLGAGWSTSGMSLSSSIDGVTVESIGGELRVTRINLKGKGLTGHIDVPEIGNLKELRYLNLFYNNLVTQIPAELGNCTNLVYLYLNTTGGYESVDPHEEAQTGGGDVHPGKSRASNDNHIYGPVPSSLGNLENLEWLILNWTDSADDAADGISSVPVELFNITTFVGLQIYDNNNIADLPFPSAIADMKNLQNLAMGVQNSGRDTGWVTGTMPSLSLPNLKFLRLRENPNLTIDFDSIDLSGLTSLRNFIAVATNTRGDFPSCLLDGTLSNLVGFNLNFPRGDGMTGSLPSGGDGMQIINVRNHNLAGPIEVWSNGSLINTDFSNNKFTGIGTDDLTIISQDYWTIRNLRWSNNEIQGRWPNLDWESDAVDGLSRVHFDNNRYVFSDMLWIPSKSNPSGKTIFDLYNDHGLSSFTYAPQKPFGQARTISFTEGSDVTLSDFDGIVTHADNRYQWQKDGSNISGATSRSLTLANAGSADEGTYRLVVTNPGVPDLTLTSEPVEVAIN